MPATIPRGCEAGEAARRQSGDAMCHAGFAIVQRLLRSLRALSPTQAASAVRHGIVTGRYRTAEGVRVVVRLPIEGRDVCAGASMRIVTGCAGIVTAA
jgi:hypothetical protein